jgi:hypothetical protein
MTLSEQWQGIESAPRDADLLLLYQPGDEYSRTGWFDGVSGSWISYDADGEWPIYPTHWQPLPEPPASLRSRSHKGGSNGN